MYSMKNSGALAPCYPSLWERLELSFVCSYCRQPPSLTTSPASPADSQRRRTHQLTMVQCDCRQILITCLELTIMNLRLSLIAHQQMPSNQFCKTGERQTVQPQLEVQPQEQKRNHASKAHLQPVDAMQILMAMPLTKSSDERLVAMPPPR